MTLLEKMIQLSPVPVRFIRKSIFWRLRLSPRAGQYCHRGIDANHPHIEVVDRLSYDAKLAVLAHEIGHAICDKRDCDCMTYDDDTMTEIHACRFALKWLLGLKQGEALRWSRRCIRFNYTPVGCRVMEQLRDSELWEESLTYG